MIKYLDLKTITDSHSEGLHEAINRVVDSGWYLQGEANKQFESSYSSYIGTDFCVGCANGLDALTLILRAYMEIGRLKEGDEILVPANTYIATILSITANKLIPVLVEPNPNTYQIEEARLESVYTPKARAVMIVHLYGRCAYTDGIGEFCRNHNLLLIEDNAQAHGCLYGDKRTGSLGNAAGHSFYPGKNLGALGDGGAVTTDDEELATMVRTLANYGSSAKYVFPYEGRNSRLDELQAAVLSIKLSTLDDDNAKRVAVARRYINEIHNPLIKVPSAEYLDRNVFHIFPVFTSDRNRLQQYLSDNGVQTMIHYPIPPHKQQCYSNWNNLHFPITERLHSEELSIPCNQILKQAEVDEIIRLLNGFS